jgi:hypothetical protein
MSRIRMMPEKGTESRYLAMKLEYQIRATLHHEGAEVGPAGELQGR